MKKQIELATVGVGDKIQWENHPGERPRTGKVIDVFLNKCGVLPDESGAHAVVLQIDESVKVLEKAPKPEPAVVPEPAEEAPKMVDLRGLWIGENHGVAVGRTFEGIAIKCVCPLAWHPEPPTVSKQEGERWLTTLHISDESALILLSRLLDEVNENPRKGWRIAKASIYAGIADLREPS